MADLSIIIVGTNERDFLYNCLKSIAQSQITYNIEIIVVDNASSDGTAAMVKERFPEAKLIINKKKLGYIINNNLAMAYAKGRYILLLNSDIELHPDTLQTMVKFMDAHSDAAVSACKLTFDDGTLQLTCRRFPTPLTYISRIPHFFRWLKLSKGLSRNRFVHSYLMMDYDHKTAREVDWVLSALFLMRRSAIDDIGLLDNNLVQPFYLEDMDWCFRARVRRWKVYYVPETSAIHFYRRASVKSFSKLSFVHLANILIFYRKHWLKMLLKKHRR